MTADRYAVGASTGKRRHVALGTVSFALTANKAKVVLLPLTRAARRLLNSKRTLKVRVTITLTAAAHRETLITRTLVLRRPAGH